MPEKNSQIINTFQTHSKETEMRFFPLFVAVLICFTVAVILGSGSWYFFGSNKRKISELSEVSPSSQIEKLETPAEKEVDSTETPNSKPPNKELIGLVEIPGNEILLGGGETKRPLERVNVTSFSIAETEVTNSQYSEFIKETNYPSPLGWKNKKFPENTENFPVTNISFQDAEAFCFWLKTKTGLPVRLPTEAEWELAARGTENNKYPWGNDWNEIFAASKEKGGKISEVKSFLPNRSPFGAYDMVGNVWEWTQEKIEKNDDVTDDSVKEALNSGKKLRIVKGGSAVTSYKELSVQARYEIPENTKVDIVGFRYIVEKKPNE